MWSLRRPTTRTELWRRRGVQALSLLLAFTLCASVALPWFYLPILGQSIPAPAWNVLGFGLFVLAGLHFARALGLAWAAWPLRVLLPWALYRWWTVEESYRFWGKSTLAALQLRLSALNQGLITLGLEPLTVFEVSQWQSMAPGWGWKLAGGSLLAAIAITAVDWTSRLRCSECREKVGPEDPFCHGCGHRFPDVVACSGCGGRPNRGDRFCRSCGKAVDGQRG